MLERRVRVPDTNSLTRSFEQLNVVSSVAPTEIMCRSFRVDVVGDLNAPGDRGALLFLNADRMGCFPGESLHCGFAGRSRKHVRDGPHELIERHLAGSARLERFDLCADGFFTCLVARCSVVSSTSWSWSSDVDIVSTAAGRDNALAGVFPEIRKSILVTMTSHSHRCSFYQTEPMFAAPC